MNNEALIKKVGILNSFVLKMIALVAMTIDHIGVFIFPHLTILRIIGRIAFPIFAFLTAVSMQYTSNKIRYFSILLGAGVVMWVVAFLITKDTHQAANIFIDLGLGALGCYFLYQKHWLSYIGIIFILAFAMAPYTFTQYGIYGTSAIMLLYLLYDKRILSVIAFIIWTVVCVYLSKLSLALDDFALNFHLIHGYFLLLGIPFILIYNEERGWYHPKLKYFFYVYYPAHIGILYLISKVI